MAARTEYYISWKQETWLPSIRKGSDARIAVVLEAYGNDPDKVRRMTACQLPADKFQLAGIEATLMAIVARMRKAGHQANLLKETGGRWGTRTSTVHVPDDADVRFRVAATPSK